MGILKGLGEIVEAPFKSAAHLVEGGLKSVGINLETGGKVLGDAAHLDGGKMISDVKEGFGKQVDNIGDTAHKELRDTTDPARGLWDVASSSTKLVGETAFLPAKLALNGAGTGLEVAGDALQGDFSGAGHAAAEGPGRQIDALTDYASNTAHNLF